MSLWKLLLKRFDRVWNGRRTILFFRNIAALAIAVVLCLVPEAGPNRHELAAFLVCICLPLATWLEGRFPVAETAWIQPVVGPAAPER